MTTTQTPLTRRATTPKTLTGRTGWNRLWQDEGGQDMIEYALAAALIGVGAVIALRSLGTKVSSAFTSIGSTLTSST